MGAARSCADFMGSSRGAAVRIARTRAPSPLAENGDQDVPKPFRNHTLPVTQGDFPLFTPAEPLISAHSPPAADAGVSA